MNAEIDKRWVDYSVRDRSNYQLKHFVVGQHDTPEMRYRQILIEAKHLWRTIKHVEIEVEIMELRIVKLRASKKPKSVLRAKQLEYNLDATRETLHSARQELAYLIELSKDYRHYTPDDIEANQPEYWRLRLTRQAQTDRIALENGIDKGNLASILNAGLLQEELTQ